MTHRPGLTDGAADGLVDSRGHQVRLGRELARGGEGSIRLIDGRSDQVAKMYLAPISPAKLVKLQAIVAMAWPAPLTRVAALATSLLSDRQGRVCGLIMPFMAGHLRSEQLTLAHSRRLHFPQADWHFLVHVAKNLAAAVEEVHRAGLVIGDLNDGSYLIHRTTGTICLVDADSFQITTAAEVFRCTVGKPLFTAPELHHADFSTCVRTADHDVFALAILIFQLLFLGRHPFAGRPLTAREISPEQAVEELRFAYGRHAAKRGIERPPNILGLDALTPRLSELFEAAFSPAGRPPGHRPSAMMWLEALDQQLQAMRVCVEHDAHKFTATLPQCPWCPIEKSSNAVLFACLIHARTTSGERSVDIQTLLREIDSCALPPLMPVPQDRPQVMRPTAWPPTFIRAQRRSSRAYLLVAVMIVVAICIMPAQYPWFCICVMILALHRPRHLAVERDRCRFALQQAQDETGLLRIRWQVEASGAPMHKLKQELSDLAKQWRGLEAAKQMDPARIENTARAQQLEAHRAACLLQTAPVPGLSAGGKATLISFGISNAGEVEPALLAQVPGLDPAVSQALIEWRNTCEKCFIFDTSYSRQAIREEILTQVRQQRQAMAERLISGRAQFLALIQEGQKQRQTLGEAWDQLQTTSAQAQADLKAINYLYWCPFLPG